ncbi:uncharacterized protein (DUF342 family) [Evansella vedderi]|uniref:Uncharacterized protein (DUF342 family) n=1 Tax=Evansella vedderi TaxID=38282 RepID=A0ABT9ZR25_9BACI|nr:FapA family protein [Evansella vedderi]MDQ0253687.1 uncharacterized protein (DUF342 family) [Evansella vedderi]
METIHDFFKIELLNNNLKAILKKNKDFEDEVTLEDLHKVLRERGIVNGINENVLIDIVNGQISLPAVIAEGLPPVEGKSAYLKPVYYHQDKDKSEGNGNDLFKDLKEIIVIPSVVSGDVVGLKVEKEDGKNGIDVLGQEIKVKPSRDFTLRPGKNTKISEDGLRVISLIDGQISPEKKVIHVFPSYEVNGDLDMKVGNIDFVGNVNIRGGVPSGFKVVAKGDIRVHGTVEGAELTAGGSIFIQQGIVAQGKGSIKAKGNLHTSFINQGNIQVDGDLNVNQSILHSQIDALGYVYCKGGRGNIVGGNISAGQGIEVNEAGNSMNTPTVFYVGVSQQVIEKERDYKKSILESESELQKLSLLFDTIKKKEQLGALSQKERILKLRVRHTIEETTALMENKKEKLLDLHDLLDSQPNAAIKIYKNVFPNTDIFFGKYRRKVLTNHQKIVFKLAKSEIRLEHL